MVTEEWIHQHKAGRIGGWNRIQLAAIGLHWPPSRGWIKEAEGSLIPLENKCAFEQCKKMRMSQDKRRALSNELLARLKEFRGD